MVLEVYLNDYTNPYIGVQSIGTAGSSATGYSQDAVALNNAGDIYYDAGAQSGAFEGSPAWANTNIISVAYDVDNNKIWWALNGQFYTANASSESTIAYSVVEAGNSAYDLSSQVTHGVAFLGSSASNGIVTINFGQDASFAGAITAGTATDGEGFGLFKYAPPSGFLALCTANLPEPTIGPNSDTQADDHFNTVLYSGDGATTQNVTGVGFQPDWTWLKERSSTSGHVLADSSRGYDKFLSSNEAIVESDGILNSASSDGFQTTNSGASNQSSQTYVSWNWKANGGTTSTLTAGTIDSVVQANTDAGFSIVTYTGDDEARATVAHGLSQAPEWVIVKNRDEAISNPAWPIYHASNTAAPATDYLDLSTTAATADAETVWSDEVPTDTLVILGTADSVNSGSAHVMYCFHSVEGYSKFGSYVSNANADGPFVHLGFKPAFLLFKQITNAQPWGIWG